MSEKKQLWTLRVYATFVGEIKGSNNASYYCKTSHKIDVSLRYGTVMK